MGSSPAKEAGQSPDGDREAATRSYAKKKKALVKRITALATFQRRPATGRQLQQQLPPVRSTRQELMQFVRDQKSGAQESWREMEAGTGGEAVCNSGLNVMVLPKIRTDEGQLTREIPNILGDNDGICFLCKEMATFNGYPCRICYKTFHKECLEKIANAKYSHGTLNVFLDNARTPGGWSCYECDNLSSLLSDDDYQEITNLFEEYGVSMDATISWDVFLSYHLHKEDDLFLDDVDHLRTQFSLLDLDCDRRISWWEFLTHEAGIKLTYRDPEELVDLLSEKEVRRAKEMFNYLDKDKTGHVMEKNIRSAFRAWYGRIDPSMKSLQRRKSVSSVVDQKDPEVLQQHVDNASSLMMEGDKHNKGYGEKTDQTEITFIFFYR
ncbi:hypothetical protein LSH36_251g04029 [Paralvinella palmiformis]|uniref:EF-hand domain-containing protein n=1 Tax=Paralvinella palmiformis TaxID=53620 RepID=A0AAD9N4E5_9ANNE|nr:hypothetical protein LSH36_251g04029 [Paralvinella palmiformis]